MTTSGKPNRGTGRLADKSLTQRKSQWPRRSRVYVLLDIVQEELADVARSLSGKPGVATVDVVQGPPDIIMVVEAHGRRRLADLTIKAISSVENVTKELRLLPVTGIRSHQADTGKQQSRVRAGIKGGKQ